MNHGMDRLVSRLGRLAWLGEAGARELAGCGWRDRRFLPRENLVHGQAGAEGIFLLVSGLACRYNISPDGRRQILGLLFPGDVCGTGMLIRQQVDHPVSALRSTSTLMLRQEAALELLQRCPRLGQALWWITASEACITRQWAVNLGSRNALERVAHLLCEIFWRLEKAGLAHEGTCGMPLTQVELGDALALSAVHVNRTLIEMRRAGLIRLQSGRLALLERNTLEQLAGFDPRYLDSATCLPCPEPPSDGDVLPAPPPG